MLTSFNESVKTIILENTSGVYAIDGVNLATASYGGYPVVQSIADGAIQMSGDGERLAIDCDDIVLMQNSLGIEVPAIQSTIEKLDSIMINGILFKRVNL